ncbi:YecA family protein [Lacrimispora sp.]|uniref:YecA family protein n=1 Tax=Lacrimispora sp. TaxID=2719234 RepID=UPI00289C0C14|nr:SEC-C metal-binding domain-containing protein [Lacrimispora sp.]
MGNKIGRNDTCPCGSGRKYKQCCLKKQMNRNEYEEISVIVRNCGYNKDFADTLCQLYRYMKIKEWIGACHATSAVLFVVLSELEYFPKLCVGEVKCSSFLFDHSWIEIDDKIVDLAISMTLQYGLPISEPIVLDLNIKSKQKYQNVYYGTSIGRGLDLQAKVTTEIPFNTYMDGFQDEEDGLWGVVQKVSPIKLEIENLKKKYENVKWNFVKDND